jgi:hypothetical protein
MRDRTGLTPIPTSLRRPGECVCEALAMRDRLFSTFSFSLEKNWGSAIACNSPDFRTNHYKFVYIGFRNTVIDFHYVLI